MKISNFAHLAVFQWQLAFVTATPVNNLAGTDIVPYTEKRQIKVTVDCNELVNQLLETVKAYPQYHAQAVAIGKKVGLPSATAYSVCKAFKTEAVDCAYAAGSVAGALSMAIVHGFIDVDPPGEGAEKATAKKRSNLLHENVGSYLRSRGTEFQSVSVLPLMDRSEEGGHTIEVLGARELGQEASTDFRIYARNDGKGHVTASPSVEDPLARRGSEKGFKVSWETWDRTGNKIPQPAVTQFGNVVADDWKARTKKNPSVGDYIGLIDFGSSGKIQFRIIPESKGFGTSHESVEKCS